MVHQIVTTPGHMGLSALMSDWVRESWVLILLASGSRQKFRSRVDLFSGLVAHPAGLDVGHLRDFGDGRALSAEVRNEVCENLGLAQRWAHRA